MGFYKFNNVKTTAWVLFPRKTLHQNSTAEFQPIELGKTFAVR
jgi:hypothetical protein